MHPTQALPALWFLIFTPFISPSSALDLGLSNRTLNTTQCLDNIERIAHGRIPAASAPLNISSEGIKSLQLIAFNELFEIAFFSSLISNISSDEPGFIVRDERRRDGILRTLRRILAQEKVHYITANQALIDSGQSSVQPCKYSFTTVCLEKALSLAATVTHLVIGTLQDVIENLAVNGDSALTRTVASVIGQEGEQEALFRHLGARRISPIEAPFTTTSSREIAFSALQQFIIPDTCPKTLNFTTFRPLILESTAVQQKDQVLDFSIDLSTPSSSWPDITLDWIQKNNASLSLAYTNQQALPILQPLQELTINGSMVAFKAFFPFSLHLLYGLTIVTLVQGHELISSVGVLNDRTLFGPALIELG